MSEMDNYYDDEYDGDDDWGEDEPIIEDMCIEPGCFEDGRHGACQCCGGPLCFMHEEILCGFCTTCTSDPNFHQRMSAMYGTEPSFFPADLQTMETVAADDEIPF